MAAFEHIGAGFTLVSVHTVLSLDMNFIEILRNVQLFFGCAMWLRLVWVMWLLAAGAGGVVDWCGWCGGVMACNDGLHGCCVLTHQQRDSLRVVHGMKSRHTLMTAWHTTGRDGVTR